MSQLEAFFLANLVPVFFVYGLSFLIMFAVIMLYGGRVAKVGLAEGFLLLGGFGLLHGLTEWTDMVRLMVTSPPDVVRGLAVLKLAFLAASFQFLLMFGFNALTAARADARPKMLIVMSPVLVAVYAVILYLTLADLGVGERAIRLTLGLGGAGLASVAFLRLAGSLSSVGLRRPAMDALVVGICFAVYAILSGVLHDPSGRPVLLVGVPVQIFRATSAVLISAFVARLLYLFQR